MKINLHNAIVEKIQTMADRSIQVKLSLPEMQPEEMTELFSALNNDIHEIGFEQDSSESKSPSARLRNVLYVIWSQSNKAKYPDFELYYRAWMEKKINEIKDKLI